MTVRPGSCPALASACCRALTVPATAASASAGMLAVCGWASQEPEETASGPAKAPACTVSGPQVVKPLAVLDPATRDVVQAPVRRRHLPGPVQAGQHEPDGLSRYPVLHPQHIAVGRVQERGGRGRQGGRMGPPAAGAPGQWPETRAACAVTPPSTAASAIGWLPALDGWADSEPGTNPSGSDQ